jgi:hypothetical protein
MLDLDLNLSLVCTLLAGPSWPSLCCQLRPYLPLSAGWPAHSAHQGLDSGSS